VATALRWRHGRAVAGAKDGREWRIGGDADVAWIAEGTTRGLAITSGIPPLFEAYATLGLPGTPNGRGGWAQGEEDLREQQYQDPRVLLVLQEHTAPQPWWLGYLDTGGADTIFSDAPMVSLMRRGTMCSSRRGLSKRNAGVRTIYGKGFSRT